MRATAVLAAGLVLATCGGGNGGDGGDGGTGLPTTGTVRGTVIDQNAEPVASASVALSATGQSTRNTSTNSAGVYQFGAVTPGTWTVTVTPPSGFELGSNTGSATVTVVAGQQASVNAITVARIVTGPPPQSADVSMVSGNSFSPGRVDVAVGGTVRFTNSDNTVHNATATNFQTGNLNPGATASVRVDQAGTHTYNCTLHAGMTGTIVAR